MVNSEQVFAFIVDKSNFSDRQLGDEIVADYPQLTGDALAEALGGLSKIIEIEANLHLASQHMEMQAALAAGPTFPSGGPTGVVN